MNRHEKTLAEEIAVWVANLRYEELPPQVIARAKLALLDSLGCLLGALEAEPVRLVRQVVLQQGGNPQATPVGLSWKTSVEQAAFLNAMAIRYLDFNDYSVPGGHPSINVAPALSIADAEGLNGKELLLGITVGYELQLRLRAAAKNAAWDQSTTAHYSAAALAGKLFKLPQSRIAHALAIAGSHASTLAEVRKGKLSMWKGAAEPMGVRNGTFAALLARAGLTGPLTIFEGRFGYGRIVAGGIDAELLRHAPKDYKILESCTKVWPCLLVAQAPIAASLKIRSRGVKPDAIARITVFLNAFAYLQQRRFSKTGISTREDADHSVPYCVARAFLDGEVWLSHFEEGNYNDASLQAFLRKISLRRDLNLPKRVGARIEVKLRNGDLCTAEVPYPPGYIHNPLSEGEILNKFYRLSERVLGRERARNAAELVLRAEKLTDVRSLMDGLRAGTEPK